MNQIALLAVANQSFSVTLDDARWDVTLKACDGIMAADVTRDDVVLAQGLRVVAGTPVLPYLHMEAGNLVLVTLDDALPWWEEFETTQALYYLSAEELAELRG